MGAEFTKPIDVRKATESDNAYRTAVYYGVRFLLDAASIPFTGIQRAADAIAKSERLHICGIGPISGRLAEMLAFTFQRMGLACMLWTDPRSLYMDNPPFAKDDVVLTISHSGVNTAVAQFFQQANEHAILTIAITNYPRSIVGQAAQLVLATNIRESRLQNYDLLLRASHMVLLQTITDLVREARWQATPGGHPSPKEVFDRTHTSPSPRRHE